MRETQRRLEFLRRVSRDSQKNNLPIAGISIAGFFFFLEAAEAATAELVNVCQSGI